MFLSVNLKIQYFSEYVNYTALRPPFKMSNTVITVPYTYTIIFGLLAISFWFPDIQIKVYLLAIKDKESSTRSDPSGFLIIVVIFIF